MGHVESIWCAVLRSKCLAKRDDLDDAKDEKASHRAPEAEQYVSWTVAGNACSQVVRVYPDDFAA